MNSIWNLTIDQYLEVCKRARENGKQAGDSMEEEFIEVMKENNVKPLGHSELSKEEYIQEAVSKNNSVLSMDNKKEGSEFKIFKKKDKI